MSTPTVVVPAWQLRPGDVLDDGSGVTLTVREVDVFGPLAIIGFTDGTATPPVRANIGCQRQEVSQ